ncbi:NYN domain-containing protein [Actinomadura madurae]|uniref:NYN domain-containing protein n=1 Tax=Actinomadura madurae TaxID=1993 RepID=UPI002025B766|nr:NYN domain-containing protein [Actinomadura madurae]MCP9951642.1 NYN domain-containing protein [Actinomadura madurae]MCP9980884.1 NYN domain-containing protein [Actinomadura madurae]MCQ0007616.1 NYN domain-containing protein [Actinomadura madurae]MCQ0017078.1 NYN domain-containing protein [Actinomadura madurae]URN08056.1 NYN domain-containing protein [Actinomadura madurae]
MDRCALFVDAGYLLADGAMAVHGTRHRETVSWDFGGLLQLLGSLARERTGMPLLRCYWYEATVEGRRNPEHDALADLPGLKLRLGRIRPGRREGVDTEIHRDLMTLARNSALTDAVLVSGDEDLAQVIADAQDFGVRVTVVHVAVDGNWTISRVLRQECDDLIEIGSGHLRPYVNMLTGMDGASSHGTSPLSNGHGSVNGHGSSIGPLQTTSHNGGPPPSSPLSGQPPATPSVRDLGPAMTGGLSGGPGTTGGVGPGPSAGTGPMPLPNGSGGGYSGSSYGTGGQQVPLQPAPAGPSSTQAPQAPAPSPSPPPAPSQPPPSPQYSSSPVPSPSPPPPPQTVQPAGQPTGQHGPYTGPQQVSPVPVQQTPTLADAVKAAHQEGQDFGESVARDAPALWLEAVLARKPRMPSDLEARLLQGSSLPIDFLLHDEVRHALRRGFWDALERSRR